MIIQSKFRDYYDSAGWVDKTVVYQRHAEALQKSFCHPLYYQDGPSWAVREAFVIGFCGEKHIGYRYSSQWLAGKNQVVKTKYDQGFGEQMLLEYLGRYRLGLERDRLQGFYADVDALDCDKICREFNTPIWIQLGTGWRVGHKERFVINPRLKDYQFPMNAAEAHQKISGYISGFLGTESPETLKINEKHKVQQRGFDKWSFRNPDPPKRKQK